MTKIEIQGIKDGVRDIAMSAGADEIEGLPEEFNGKIEITGQLRKLGKRFTFTGELEGTARLVCDRTLVEYDETIKSNISVSFIVDGPAAKKGLEIQDGEDIPIRDEDKTIDLAGEIRQQLILALPMKRIAPEYRDKELNEIFPEIVTDNNEDAQSEVDERWAALKNIKLN